MLYSKKQVDDSTRILACLRHIDEGVTMDDVEFYKCDDSLNVEIRLRSGAIYSFSWEEMQKW